MAKFECDLTGDFDEILSAVDREISHSVSASTEGSSFFRGHGCRVAVRVYERYSFWGSNRVSLTFTLFETGNRLCCSAISAGGSQAVFFKINTVGEENFLSLAETAVAPYRTRSED